MAQEVFLLEETNALNIGDASKEVSAYATIMGTLQPSNFQRLLGEELCQALRRRGMSVEAIDWSVNADRHDMDSGFLDWSGVSRISGPDNFCSVRLPFFARLMHAVESGSSVAWSEATAMAESVESVIRFGTDASHESLDPSQLSLLTMLVCRVADLCVKYRPPEDVEILLQCQSAVSLCVSRVDLFFETVTSVAKPHDER